MGRPGPSSVPRVVLLPACRALPVGVLGGLGALAAFFLFFLLGRLPSVYRLARTLLGDSELAEEVAQEAFLRAWRHAEAYDPRRGQVSTWLLTITRNLAIDRLRVKRAEPLDPEALQRVVDETARGTDPAR